MKATILSGLGVLTLGGLFVSACNSPARQESASSPAVDEGARTTAKPEVSINAVMVALVDHAGHQLWNVEIEGKAPKTDADWENVQEHAVQIAAAGPAITVGGTGPSDAIWVKSSSWQGHAQRMSDAGVAAMNMRAAALLGDPQLLIFDEPVNGLDPEGIVWIRTLMRSLAAEGRTVFVSSHLMAEMALTADHVIVIGKGRLLAEASVHDLIHNSAQNFHKLSCRW